MNNILKKFIISYPMKIETFLEEIDINTKIKKVSISAVIITKNEEYRIARCINSIIDYVDEVIVLDTGSSDKTLEIIENMQFTKVKVFEIEWNNNFSATRNYALSKASCEWVFFIDADEYYIGKSNFDEILTYFSKLKCINETVLSPKIIDVNGHTSIGVGRLFKKNGDLSFFGTVHEEIRINNKGTYRLPFNISVDIPLMHDGYTAEVMKKKNKIERNISLIKQMMKEEPYNLRWVFFYLRDGEEVLSIKDIENIAQKAILIDPEIGFCEDNIVKDTYTYPILSILISKMLCWENDSKKINKLIDLLEKINHVNSDSLFYRSILEVNNIKKTERRVLNDLIRYRKDNFSSQYGAIHSEGKNIDLLIGYFLFELGYIDNAKKYFEYVQDIGEDNILILECKNKIENILKLYTD